MRIGDIPSRRRAPEADGQRLPQRRPWDHRRRRVLRPPRCRALRSPGAIAAVGDSVAAVLAGPAPRRHHPKWRRRRRHLCCQHPDCRLLRRPACRQPRCQNRRLRPCLCHPWAAVQSGGRIGVWRLPRPAAGCAQSRGCAAACGARLAPPRDGEPSRRRGQPAERSGGRAWRGAGEDDDGTQRRPPRCRGCGWQLAASARTGPAPERCPLAREMRGVDSSTPRRHRYPAPQVPRK